MEKKHNETEITNQTSIKIPLTSIDLKKFFWKNSLICNTSEVLEKIQLFTFFTTYDTRIKFSRWFSFYIVRQYKISANYKIQ